MKYLAFAFCASSFIFSCSKASSDSSGAPATQPKPPEPTPTPPEDPKAPPVGKISEEAGFFVKVEGDVKDYFNVHKDKDTFDAPCNIAVGERANCFVEAEEHTLYDKDFALHYHVPKSMCDYVSIMPFYFVNRRTKLQTTDLHTYVDSAGNYGSAINGSNIVNSTDFGCYSESKDPVCCVGKYTQVNHVWSATSTPAGFQVTTEAKDRKIDACLEGPAMVTQPKTAFGNPVSTYTYVKDKGLSVEYKIERGAARLVPSAWSANFFAASEHSGGMPSAFNYDINSANPSSPWRFGYPYYTISCRDSAYEVIAEARIQIRDWNTTAAYKARATAPTNHDITGTEPSPFGDYQLNDYEDWKDIELRLPTAPFPGYDAKKVN